MQKNNASLVNLSQEVNSDIPKKALRPRILLPVNLSYSDDKPKAKKIRRSRRSSSSSSRKNSSSSKRRRKDDTFNESLSSLLGGSSL